MAPKHAGRVIEWRKILIHFTRKESGILNEENRAFKAVLRNSGGTTIIDSIAWLRLVILHNINRRKAIYTRGFRT